MSTSIPEMFPPTTQTVNRRPRIFLSMVTSEFGWLRVELDSILAPAFEVRTQEYEAQSPLNILSVS